MNEAIIRVENFSFAFNGTPVLEDINFNLNPGDALYIIGPNGAGKSTLLKSLLNLHEYGKGSGEVWIKNRPLNAYKQRELARVMSYVPQAGGWIPPFTVGDFLRLSRYSRHDPGFSPRAGKGDDTAVREALQLARVEEFVARPLRTLSGGERQRAYVAAALAQDAEIMLLDEPTSFLDPKHAHDLNQVLARLNNNPTQSVRNLPETAPEDGQADHPGPSGTACLTTLTVTHDLNQALAAHQQNGKVLVLAKCRQVYFGGVGGLLDGAILRQAFNHDFFIFKHPHTGLPVVLTS